MDTVGRFFSFIQTHIQEILNQTYEHLWITTVALTIAIVIGVVMGILLTRYQTLSRPILGFVNIVQTIPSVALLGFMLPFFGIGVTPAIIALFLYALLPIVRNTYTGIVGVDSSVVEAARGLGMSDLQILQKVELPLALPIIFAGIRTAMVINIGVATLCALIAAGGLGEYIFRGIAVNNVNMILAGAIPASLLAIVLDALLSIIQKYIRQIGPYLVMTFGVVAVAMLGYTLWNHFVSDTASQNLVAGFNPEFMEREDGYPDFVRTYGFEMDTREMEIGLMYEALRSKKVDVISGFSTDGRIKAYHLKVLKDDEDYFPPYYAAPLIRQATLEKYPELVDVLNQLADKISEEQMMSMNFSIDQEQKGSREVARSFLQEAGFELVPKKTTGDSHIVIGSKNFSENLILAEMFAALIEANTPLRTEMKLGFGGTKLLMDAIKIGEVDLYPEYTGTGLLVLLQTDQKTTQQLGSEAEKVYRYVKQKSLAQFGLVWLNPLGFNNTTALMMREKQASSLNINTISELGRYIKSQK